ncbi:MAG: histidine kinase [Oscillospiraceae bacterium]|nr:histidine kinase [Oscillospiraceae bacterium]
MMVEEVKAIEFVNVVLYTFSILVALTLLFGCIMDRSRSRPFMKFFMALLSVDIVSMFGEMGLWLFHEPALVPLAKISALVAFGGGTVLNALYAYCLVAFIRERTKISWKYAHVFTVICAIYLILVIISLFNGMLFDFDEKGFYLDGPLYWIVRVIDTVTWLMCIGLVIFHRKVLTLKGMFSLLSFSILPLLSMGLLFIWDATPLSLATTLSLIILYSLFHGELTRQLAEQEIQLAQQKQQITEQRIATMISQIQPHFIYNTLGSIYQLCLLQPKQAAELTQNFALYLRGNFSELDNSKPVRLSQELEHVKYYLNIEKIRFPDMEVQFDLQSDEFFLPALTIQPLVENAIKHGLMGLESGGTVVISTYETDDSYCVKVQDNGVGFDESVFQDGKKHIGIQNIRGRLEAMCNGTLTVESQPNQGTTAIITIPKEVMT